METWFLNPVLGLSLSVLLLGLPGALGAGTPSNSSTDPFTTHLYYSAASDELSNTENNATSTSASSESLSPSQRSLLLTHTAETHTAAAAAGNSDTEQTQTFTETSSRSLETTGLSTEPLASTLVVATTEASSSSSSSSSSTDWKEFIKTDHVTNASRAVFFEDRSSVFTEGSRLPQDSAGTTLRLEDATAFASQTAGLTDGSYASTTISRAGERTLLSVTSSSSNSTSSVFTEDSNSQHPPSTRDIGARTAETEGYTHSAPSTRTDSKDTTERHMTHSFKAMSSETGSPGASRGTQSLTGPPNATRHQHTSTSEETSDSTPLLRVTEPSTDPFKVSDSSTPAVTSPAEGATNISGTNQESVSYGVTTTASSTAGHSSSTQNQEGTEGVSSQTREESVGSGLTTVSPTVSSSTSDMDHSLADMPAKVTEVFLSTAPVTITGRSQITEEDTFKATPSTATTITTTINTATATTTINTTTPTSRATTPSLPATSKFSSTTSSSIPESFTEAKITNTTPSTTASTLDLLTSPGHSTYSVPTSQTQGPSTGTASTTDVTTLQSETTKASSVEVTTAHSHYITTTYTHSPPARSTEALHTIRKQTDRGTTELVVTSPTDIRPIKVLPPTPPSNVHECKRNYCQPNFSCMNTQGSISCECPLGFDLEDGRTCTRAKTFLGTFSVNTPHDLFKDTTMIQREIIQLLSASLSVLQGYRHSTLSTKKGDLVNMSAVNIFSISSNVTSAEVNNSIQMALRNCNSPSARCRVVPNHNITYYVESLCAAQKPQCDRERSTCTDNDGTAYCQCLQGYYKHNPEDLSCLECGDGYKLENSTCVPCVFGFGGFNCGNFYKLIAVVVSPAGGAVLLILIIALIVTCCKKDKNDINKIIFKSGDLQMSPYADFPKNTRISMEWGRETIEMQENGSTKNLLQMTDIYYSPALRNSDLDRNGLYPFMGLPGSRHSCIYPAQWNPSFISDDSRRRDYF